MPMVKLALKPGVQGNVSQTAAEGGYSASSGVRWKAGWPQKYGGWQRVSEAHYQGQARGMHSFREISGNQDLGLGTNLFLYLWQGGTYYDVTPIRKTVNPMSNNPVTTINGQSTVTIHDVAHGAVAGDYALFSGLTAVAAITVSGLYPIASVVDADNYTILTTGTANASTTGGGAAGIVSYLLPVGLADAASAFGWGAGTWGSGTWGTPRTTGAFAQQPRTWAIDNWGEEMLASPRDGGIYDWKPSGGVGVRAVILTNAPTLNRWMTVGMPERHVIAFGCDTGGVQDTMLIRWSDTEDYIDWTATATNSAGSFRLARGNTIQRAQVMTREILVWTDRNLTSMAFVGLPYVYSFQPLGDACGLIAPLAAGVLNGIAYWMSDDHFNYYDGAVHTLECDLWSSVFRNLNKAQKNKVCCAVNSAYGEIIWFYPSASATEIDSCVIYNLAGFWYGHATGAMPRTCWEDRDVFDYPIAADPNTMRLQYHEFGVDADGAAMTCSLETGASDIGDGEDFTFIDFLIPDMTAMDGPGAGKMVGTINMTLKAWEYPHKAPFIKGPKPVTATTRAVGLRNRGRQVALLIDSGTVGDNWRVNATRARIAPDGRR